MNTTRRRNETAATERARDSQRGETKRRQRRHCTEAVLSKKMRRARTGQSKGHTSRPAAKSDRDTTKKELRRSLRPDRVRRNTPHDPIRVTPSRRLATNPKGRCAKSLRSDRDLRQTRPVRVTSLRRLQPNTRKVEEEPLSQSRTETDSTPKGSTSRRPDAITKQRTRRNHYRNLECGQGGDRR